MLEKVSRWLRPQARATRPFAQPAAIAAIVGRALDLSELLSVYARCLPGARALITGVQVTPHEHAFEYAVDWLDHEGRLVSHVVRTLKRHEGGALELHGRNVWVDPAFRGRAASARVHAAELAFLRGLSDHPDTRISLRAGWMLDPNDRTRRQRLGVYTWACFGYDFQERYPRGEKVIDYGPPLEPDLDDLAPGEHASEGGCSQLAALIRAFARWMALEVATGRLRCSAAELAAVVRRAASWQHPWEIAALDEDGLWARVEVEGQTLWAPLGKAFLLSTHAPSWDGVFFVNRRDFEGLRVFGAYHGRVEARARTFERRSQVALHERLRSDEAAQRRAAIDDVARTLDPATWVDVLWALHARDHENREAIEGALRRLDGEAQRRAQRRLALDADALPLDRLLALERLSELEEGTAFPVFARVIRGTNLQAAELALRSLYEREFRAAPARVAEEARAVLALHAESDVERACPDLAFLRSSARVILAYAELASGPKLGASLSSA